MHKTLLSTLILLLAYAPAVLAQTDTPEMADALRRDGKIYVVVLVLITIFIGIIAFLIRLERKISKLEKES